MQIKGNAAANPRAQLYCGYLYVYLYTHTYYQPYHPWPFNRLKTSKCINLEHQKGVSHKTKAATLLPSCCSWKSRKMAPSHCTAWEREISKTSGPKRWTTLWSTKTNCQPVNLQVILLIASEIPDDPPPLTCYLMKPLWKMGYSPNELVHHFFHQLMFLEQPGGEIDPPKVLPCWIFSIVTFLWLEIGSMMWSKLWTLESNDMGHHFLDLPPQMPLAAEGLVADPRSPPQTVIIRMSGDWHRGSGG